MLGAARRKLFRRTARLHRCLSRGSERVGLLGENAPNMSHSPLDIPSKSPVTPLTRELYHAILHRGPMTVAEYMRHCLTHPVHGYYMRDEVIGRSGDFVTGPELTSLYGEMVGIWLVVSWTECGSPPHYRLCEVGPGKGTLTRDVLRTLTRFPDCFEALTAVHFVDVSPRLRMEQAKTMGVFVEEGSVGAEGAIDEDGGGAALWLDPKHWQGMCPSNAQLPGEWGPIVQWHSDLLGVPKDGAFFGICHELFDAIGVHQVQKVTDGTWREWLVDIDGQSPEEGGGEHHFRLVLSPQETPASQYFQIQRPLSPLANDTLLETAQPHKRSTKHEEDDDIFAELGPILNNLKKIEEEKSVEVVEDHSQKIDRDFEVVEDHSRKIDRDFEVVEDHSQKLDRDFQALDGPSQTIVPPKSSSIALDSMLSEISSRVKSHAQDQSSPRRDLPTLNPEKNDQGPQSWIERAPEGTRVEFSNRSMVIVHELAQRIGSSGGAAIIVDYGKDGASSSSLRGIKDHQFVDILSEPGRVDLSADVDFAALKQAALLEPNCTVQGPISQSQFLQGMGIRERLQHALELAVDEQEQDDLIAAVERLLHPEQMGEIYQVLQILAKPPQTPANPQKPTNPGKF